MKTLTLSVEQVSKLETALLEIPGKFGVPILQLLQLFIQENQTATEEET